MTERAGPGRFDGRGQRLDGGGVPRRAVLTQASVDLGAVRLRAALEALPEVERLVFILGDLEGWSIDAIAAGLDQVSADIRRRLYRARLRIQERLTPHGQGQAWLAISCREVRGRLAGQAVAALGWKERLVLRLHLNRCCPCARFDRAVRTLPAMSRTLLAQDPGAPVPEAALRALAGALRRLQAEPEWFSE